MKREFLGRHYQTGKAVRVSVEHGRYQSIAPVETEEKLPWIAPGLVDVQINGFGGIDFNSPVTKSGVEEARHCLANHACTHFLATIITNPLESYRPLLEGIHQHGGAGRGAQLFGIHLEGPFLNPDPATRGAHPAESMLVPRIELVQQWQEWSEQKIRLVTMAPEIAPEESLSFIQFVVKEGIRVAAGHSLVRGEPLDHACRAGLSGWTHLGNAAGAEVAKFDNVIFHTLASAIPYVSLIPDGFHVPEYAFKVMANYLQSRLILTTDAMSAAGARPGIYNIGKVQIRVENDGVPRLENGRMAGSSLSPLAGVFRAAAMSGLPWSECWTAFSTRPASWLGLPHALAPEYPANFVLLAADNPSQLLNTVINGEPVISRM